MTSAKQLNANRENAKKSTGPQSQAGKDRSRLNSRKHGLTARMIVMVGECADDFDQLRAGLMEERKPQSLVACELVEQLAGILWRLRRVPTFELAILDAQYDRIRNQYNYRAPEPESDDPEKRNWKASVDLGNALIYDARYSDALGKLTRHETTLRNALAKTLQMLLLHEDKRDDTQTKPVVLEAVAGPPAKVFMPRPLTSELIRAQKERTPNAATTIDEKKPVSG